MIKARYVAQIEVDFTVDEKGDDLLPFDAIQRNVREELTPAIRKVLGEALAGGPTDEVILKVTQQYADAYLVEDEDD